ncbi:DEAD/DEAH box helicase [Candidatus Woesearchaeota archaeon]|nr:DEAD/DEAH box helicase [Candidatus Woesearchaeota archaeon]
MNLNQTDIPSEIKEVLTKEGINELRPAQEKAIKAGVLDGRNILVCTPTASGKTLIAELVGGKNIITGKGKIIYIVPLVALANEKHKEFKRKYGRLFKIALSVGDFDSSDSYLIDYDFIICTAEKLDSLIRHHAPWLKYVSTVIIDEIHLLNDVSRGPTLEILITVMKQILENVQIIGLSATIGNPLELATWLDAVLIQDDWRPVPLKKGVYHQGEIEFNES